MIVVALMTTMIVPFQAWGASSTPPAWTVEGTPWATPLELPETEVERFEDLWTTRFLDSAGLQAYLDRPGLYEDGFNGLPEAQKKALVVDLVEHWQATLPAFGRDLWTGEAAADQKAFEELAIMMYATIFAKDEFLASIREAAGARAAAEMVGPPAPVDAGIPEYPGMSQDEITAYFDSLHTTNTIVTPRPAAPDLGVPFHERPDQGTVVDAPPMPALPAQGADGETSMSIDTSTLPTPTLDGILGLVTDQVEAQVALPDPNALLNLVAGGTYLACGSYGNGPVQCAPAPVPIGAPIALDLDGNALTGVAGAEVTVLLGPTIHPDFAVGGFAALLRVDRTQPSTLPLSPSLPAQAYVVYTVPGAAKQVIAGFDARTNTLGDTQEVRVTVKDVAAALAGDVRLLTEITRAGPGSTLTLLGGYAQVNPASFPPTVSDPTTLGLRFDPVPDTFSADLRFASVGGQGVIEGKVRSSIAPTVTATIDIRNGNTHRVLTGIIEAMPTVLDFTVVSQAVGAVSLDYVANAAFPRFELHDVLTPDTSVPSKYSTLDAVVHGIPASIHFDITRPFNVNYVASGRVGDASIAIVERDSAGIVKSMAATATGIPSQWSITGSTSPIRIDYSANGVLNAIDAVMTQRGSGSAVTVYTASVASLPPFLRISANPNEIIVDARSSAAAASGTGTIGNIAARYTTDGTFVTGSGNHANLYQTATITRASIGYSGLKYIRVSQVSDNLVVDVQNSAPRYFTAWADTPEAYVSIVIDSIPAHVSVTGTGTTFTYNAYGSIVNTISANFWDKASLYVIVTVRGIPGSASINANLPAKTITYAASSAISSIDVDAWIGAWYGTLRITGVPTAWTTSFGNGVYSFDAYPQSIGSVRAAVTNHGSYTTLGGNHLNLDYIASPETIDASFLMTAVQRATYTRSLNNQFVDLRMGGGTSFVAYLEASLSNGERALGYLSFNPLPSSIQATIGEKIIVNTNQNFDTYLYGEYGTPAALANAPAPPFVHGISVRDGASGTAKALKGLLYLTGLPTSVNFDARNRTFGFTNWRPTTSTLVADAELDNFVSPAVDLYVSQSGIPNPQSLTFTMSSEDIGSGNKRVKVDVTQTAGMGALYADLLYAGTQHGRLTVSNIPDDIHATYTLTNGQSTLVWDATAAISSIYAGFRVTTQSASFQGYVSLTDLPSDFTMTFGRASGGQGPTLSYSATASTLDVNAFVDASLFGGDLKARLSFGLTNLGASTAVYVSGTGIRFTSTPATGSLYAAVWATYNYYRADSGIWDAGGFLEYPWAYHVGVTPTVNNLAVTLTSFSDFSMLWGVTTKLSGSYGSFSFGWSSFTVDLHAYGMVRIVVDWPWPFGSSDINIVNIHYHPGTWNINVLFHKYTNHQAYWGGVSGSPCDWSVWMDIRPHPHGAAWNGVSASSATAEGGAWYVTPNPWGVLPGWGVDLAARYTSPDGGNVGGPHFSYDCF